MQGLTQAVVATELYRGLVHTWRAGSFFRAELRVVTVS